MELKNGKKGLELGIVKRESGIAEHTHLNKSTLDLIEQALTTALKTAYDDAVTKVHEHSNKEVLDLVEEALTSALKTAYDDAVTKAHVHANKAALDLIEEAFTTVLKNKLDGIESGAVSLATVKADVDISDAITKKHSHDNKATLDAIEQAFTTVLKDKLDGIEAGAVSLATVKADTDISDAIDKKHHRSHALDDWSDHHFATMMPGNLMDANPDGLPHDSEIATTDVSDAIDKKHSKIESLRIDIDGGGSVITTGVKGHIEVPYACEITKVTLLASPAGDIVIDIWKGAWGSFPIGLPTVANTITASAKPTLYASQKSYYSALIGWTKSISAEDILVFNVDSCTTIKRVTLTLTITKS